METIIQAIKYGFIGIVNTLLTAAVIWVMMKMVGASDYFSNIVGYAVGVANSFFCNRRWTFQSNTGWLSSGIRFLAVFGVCYILQLLLVIYLNKMMTNYDPYYNQLVGMAFYTIINFIMNKLYTFKEIKE